MRTMQDWLSEYGDSHQNPTNKLVHWICVPSIVFSILALLWAIPLNGIMDFIPPPMNVWVNVATMFYLFALLFYLRLSSVMAIGMAVVVGMLLLLISWLDSSGIPLVWTAIGVFVIAWIGQFIGHHIEGKKPSFLKDVQFLLIGPAWLLSFIYNKIGIKY